MVEFALTFLLSGKLYPSRSQTPAVSFKYSVCAPEAQQGEESVHLSYSRQAACYSTGLGRTNQVINDSAVWSKSGSVLHSQAASSNRISATK